MAQSLISGQSQFGSISNNLSSRESLNYLVNQDVSASARLTGDSAMLSTQSQATVSDGDVMRPPYNKMMDDELVSELEALAQAGMWDRVRELLQQIVAFLDNRAATDGNQVTREQARAYANALRPFVNMPDAQLNNTLFGGKGTVGTNTGPLYQPYVPQTDDTLGEIVEGNRQNLINELLDGEDFVIEHFAQYLNDQYQADFTKEERLRLQSMADSGDIEGIRNLIRGIYSDLLKRAARETNRVRREQIYALANRYLGYLNMGGQVINRMFTRKSTGYLLFDEKKWQSKVKQLQKWNNLMAILAKLQEAMHEGQNTVHQEMIQVRGYQNMNLTELVNKENSLLNQFASAQVRDLVETVKTYNENYSSRLKKRAEKKLNSPQAEFILNVLGFVLNLMGLVLAVAGGGPVVAAITSTAVNNSILKLTTEDDVAYQKRLAEIEEKLAQAREAQQKETERTEQEIQAKQQEWQQAIQEGQAVQAMLAEALSLGVELGMLGLNSADFVGITANGYHELARGKILGLQNQIQSLVYLIEHLRKLQKEQLNSHSRIHQEMTGVKGYKAGELDASVTAAADEMLKTFQRKVQYLSEAVSSYNQARQAHEEALAAERTLNGRLANGIITGMFGALAPLSGNYYLGVFTGGLGGYLNYRTTRDVIDQKKNYDPGALVQMQNGNTINPNDFSVEAALHSQNSGASTALAQEIEQLALQDLGLLDFTFQKTSKNRFRFDHTAASAIARRLEVLRRIERILVTLKEEELNARGRVRAQLSEGASDYETGGTAQKAVSQKHDLYAQAFQLKNASLQDKIRAHNQRILDQMNIERARFGIYTSAASGALSGMAAGMIGTQSSDYLTRALMRSGDSIIAGLGNEMYEIHMPDADYNLYDQPQQTLTYQQFKTQEQLHNNLDDVLASMDAGFYQDLVVKDARGNYAVNHNKLMEKIKKINTQLMFEKAMAAIKKAIAEARNLVAAEMSGKSGHRYTELGNQTTTNEKALAVSSVKAFAAQLQEITALRNARADARFQYNRSLTRTGLVAGIQALGAFSTTPVMEGGFQTASHVAGAGADLAYATEDLHEKALIENLNRQDQISQHLQRNQADTSDRQLARLDRLEAELTLKSLYLKQISGEFGITTVNAASLELIKRLLDKIEKIREAFHRARNSRLAARAEIHSTLSGGGGASLTGIAAEIGKLVNQYVEEIVQEQENNESEKEQLENKRSKQVMENTGKAYSSVGSAVLSTGQAVNSGSLTPMQSRQLWDSLSQMQNSYAVVGRYQTKGRLEDEKSGRYATRLNLSESEFENLNQRDLLAISAKGYQSDASLTRQTLQLQNNLTQFLGQSMMALSVYFGARAHEQNLMNSLREKIYTQQLEQIRREINQSQEKMDLASAQMQTILERMQAHPDNRAFQTNLASLQQSVRRQHAVEIMQFFNIAEDSRGNLQIAINREQYLQLKSAFKTWDTARAEQSDRQQRSLHTQNQITVEIGALQKGLLNYQASLQKINLLTQKITESTPPTLPVIPISSETQRVTENLPVSATQKWIAQYFMLKPSEQRALQIGASAEQREFIQTITALKNAQVENFKDSQTILAFDEKYGSDNMTALLEEYENASVGANLSSESYTAVWRYVRSQSGIHTAFANAIKMNAAGDPDIQNRLQNEILKTTADLINKGKPEWRRDHSMSQQEAEQRALSLWIGALAAADYVPHLKTSRQEDRNYQPRRLPPRPYRDWERVGNMMSTTASSR